MGQFFDVIKKPTEFLEMKIAGKRVRQTRLIQRGRYVIAVDVEAVIPEDDPSEPC